jgi:hypothetical protein
MISRTLTYDITRFLSRDDLLSFEEYIYKVNSQWKPEDYVYYIAVAGLGLVVLASGFL